MSKWVLSILFLLPTLSFAQNQNSLLVSGFDDVLRQANNTGLINAGLKLFEKDRTFAGMPELYAAMTSQEIATTKFTIVSAISSTFDSRIRSFLQQSRYPVAQLHLRNWMTEWSIENFKIASIEKILALNPNRNFTVVFDNSVASIRLVSQIREKFPSKSSVIYLRQTVFGPAPAGATMFVTAYEIALNEYRFQRLAQSDVNHIADAIVNETDPTLIIPDYAYCPLHYDPCTTAPQELQQSCRILQRKIIQICEFRKKS